MRVFQTLHVYTFVSYDVCTGLPRVLIVVRADEILTRLTENKSRQPRHSDRHSCHTLMNVKKGCRKLSCLTWKFMRLHVAISFEKLFISKEHK